MKTTSYIIALSALTPLIAPLATAGELSLGAGAYSSKSEYIDFKDTSGALPIINYQGEGWSIGASGLTIDLLGNEDAPLSVAAVVASVGNGFDEDDSKAFSGMKKRDDSIDLGVAIDYKLARGKIGASLMGDVSSTHKGFVFDVNYSQGIPLFGGFFEPSIGIEMQSSDFTDYYYGVSNSEATASRSAYAADSAVNPYIEYSYMYPINDNIKLLHGANFTKLDSEIEHSSIVDRSNTWSTFVGISYTF
jgi:outer membrane protein